MTSAIRYIARGACLVTVTALLAGCVLAPPDHGGYDHRHDRYGRDRSYHCQDRGDRDDRDDRDDRCRD